MNIQTILAPVSGILPAAWGDDVRLAVAALLVAAGALAIAVLIAVIAEWRRAGEVEVGPASSADTPPATTKKTAAPDLDPEEWVSGNVIHFDRYRAVGLIRCDRVKGAVRFQAADFKRAPRVGEKVRFKGRHGARRKPVALIVERAS